MTVVSRYKTIVYCKAQWLFGRRCFELKNSLGISKGIPGQGQSAGSCLLCHLDDSAPIASVIPNLRDFCWRDFLATPIRQEKFIKADRFCVSATPLSEGISFSFRPL